MALNSLVFPYEIHARLTVHRSSNVQPPNSLLRHMYDSLTLPDDKS